MIELWDYLDDLTDYKQTIFKIICHDLTFLACL